jgi:hypothetical protein
MTLFATTDWVRGQHKWIVGDRASGKVICSGRLVPALRMWMRRNGKRSAVLTWDNDGRQEVVATDAKVLL